MTRFRQKIEAQTKQIVGQMIGDDQLIGEGRKEQQAEIEAEQEQKDDRRDRPASTSQR